MREAGKMYGPEWNALMEEIRTHGPLHDSEEVDCVDCGTSYRERMHVDELRRRCPECGMRLRYETERQRLNRITRSRRGAEERRLAREERVALHLARLD